MIDSSIAYGVAVLVGIVLCFWGLKATRIIVSISFGGFLGYLGLAYTWLATGSLILSVLVFFIMLGLGLMIGFALFKATLSLIFGYVAARTLLYVAGGSGVLLTVLGTLVIAAIAYTLANYLIAAGLALTGSALIFKGLMGLGLKPWASIVIALAVFVAGLYKQAREERKSR